MNPQIQLILQQAIQAFQNRNFDDANLLLKRILQVDSKNFLALHILGLIRASQLKYGEAINYLSRAARIQPNNVLVNYNLAKALSDFGNEVDALKYHKKTVNLDPSNPNAWLNYGLSAYNLGRHEEALNYFDKSLILKPDYAEGWSNKGLALKELKRYHEALIHFDKSLTLKSDYAEAWLNKGVTLFELKRSDEALIHYDKALIFKSDYAEAWFNKGVTLYELKRFDEALTHYDKVLELKPDYSEAWLIKGIILYELKRFDEALVHFDEGLTLKPNNAEAWLNKGLTLYKIKRFDEALIQYDKALTLKPDYAEAWLSKGVILAERKCFDEALYHYDKAQSIKPDYAEAWSNKAAILDELRRYREAITNYEKALSLKSEIDWRPGDLLHVKMKICSWSDLSDCLIDISRRVTLMERVVSPFLLLALNDDALLHKKSSEIFSQSKYPVNSFVKASAKPSKKQKIKIGYFSPDFKNHPVSYLTAELYQLHDRGKFEIIAFSFGVDDQSAMRKRLVQSFDQFIDVTNMSDSEIAELSRNLQIDIAVDLAGYTKDSRTGIFSHRAAPIQTSYVGYLGTMGAEYYDYLLADKTIIPNELKKFYSEKIVYLPSYQVNDRKRIISEKKFTRLEFGLPETGFVFCCFNNNYKIQPSIFDSWMRILNAVEGSVLFLYADNDLAKANLINEASIRGVGSARLVFGGRIPPEEYLARYRVCDLFLDTFPYNAGTTASDSLLVSVPVLTLMGKSFASRIAASILNAIDLPEMIATSQDEYEALAIELAKNNIKLAEIKEKLNKNRLTTPLFDTPMFTKNIECAYMKMYEQYQAGLQPDHIVIG